MKGHSWAIYNSIMILFPQNWNVFQIVESSLQTTEFELVHFLNFCRDKSSEMDDKNTTLF